MVRKTGIFLLLSLLLLVPACTTKIAYNYLDWIIDWYASDLVTLNDEQDWLLNDAIKSELTWHRRHQLPFYISSLDDLEKNIQKGLDIKDLKKFYSTHEQGWMDLKHRVTPAMARLLKTLDDSQIRELQENLKEQEDELEEKYVKHPPDELIEERSERMIDKIEDWTGSLNKQQEKIVMEWSRNVKPISKTWIETRRNWQANLIQILQEYRDKPEYNELIKDLFYNSRKFWPAWYHEAYYENVDTTLTMFTQLVNTLSDRQKKRLLRKIDKLRTQFIELYDEQ